MHRPLRAGLRITFGLLIISIIGGCGEDDPTQDGEIKLFATTSIKLLSTTPEDGGTISVSGELRMVFDGALGGVTVDGMRATIIVDHIARMQIPDLGEFTPGAKKTVTILWTSLDFSFVGT